MKSLLSVLALCCLFTSLNLAYASESPDLVQLIGGSGQVVFLRDELVPATSLDSIYGRASSSGVDVIYQGSLRFVGHGDSSIDPSKLSCLIQYSNSEEASTFKGPLTGIELREGDLITGIDASFQAGQNIAWDAPNAFSEAVSYSYPGGDHLVVRGFHLNFYGANTALVYIDCDESVPADASPMTVADFEQATGGLLTVQAQ